MPTVMSAIIKNYFGSYAGLKKSCWQGIVLNFVESSLAGVYYFLSIYFVDVLHINIAVAGFLISFYGLGTVLGGFIGGKVSDRIASSTVSMVSLLFQSLAFLVLIKIKAPVFLGIDLFFLGIATYSFITSNYVSVLNACGHHETERLKAINTLSVASNLGIGISAMMIGELVDAHFQYLFYVASVLLALAAVFLYFQQKIPQPIVTKIMPPSNANRKPILKGNLIGLALTCLFFTGMIVSQLSTTYSLYLKTAFPQLGLHAFSRLFFLNTALVVIFQNYLVNQLSDNNKMFMIGVGSFLIGFGMFSLNYAFDFSFAILACIIYSLGEMIFFSMVQLFCYQEGADEKKGSRLGAYRMVYASSRFLGPTVGSSIYYYLGGDMVWYFSGLIGLLFLLICGYYKKYT